MTFAASRSIGMKRAQQYWEEDCVEFRGNGWNDSSCATKKLDLQEVHGFLLHEPTSGFSTASAAQPACRWAGIYSRSSQFPPTLCYHCDILLYSQGGQISSSLGPTWELVRNAKSQPHSRPTRSASVF
jgi:hypothetical protein